MRYVSALVFDQETERVRIQIEDSDTLAYHRSYSLNADQFLEEMESVDGARPVLRMFGLARRYAKKVEPEV